MFGKPKKSQHIGGGYRRKVLRFLIKREIASESVPDGSYPVIRKKPKKVNDFHPFKAIIEKQV